MVKPTNNDEDMSWADPLLTLKQVAKMLGLSERTVRRLISSRKLTAVRAGRRYRFRREDVSEFIRSSLTNGAPRKFT